MAPSQVDGDALSRVMGSSESNWSKAIVGGTGVAVFGIALRRLLETEWVKSAAREVVDQHAILRAQAVENAKGKLCFQASKSGSPTVEVLPWPRAEGANLSGVFVLPDDDGNKALSLALHKVVRDEMNFPFATTDKTTDLFQVHVYSETSRSQTIVALRFHSGGLDRPSALTAVQQFFTALSALVDGQTPQLTGNPGKNELFPPIEDLIPKGKASKNFLQKGIDTVGYALSVKKYSLLPFQPGFTEQRKEPFQSDLLMYTLGRAGTVDLLAACKLENTTLAGALSAALLKTAAASKELQDQKKDEFSFTSLVDCRAYFEPSFPTSIAGNYVAGIPQGAQAKESMSFWDLARSVSSTTEKDLSKSRQFSEIPVLNMLFSQVLKHPGVTPSSSLRTALFSIFVDEPMKPQWKDLEKLQVAGAFGPFPSMHGVGPCFALCETMLEGPDLSLSFIYTQPVYSRSQMETFATSALELLNSAAKGH